jgi:predicted PurR-regulated permease PerM
MQILVALTVGLVAWIALWAFGVKPLDGFLVTILFLLMGTVMRMVQPLIREYLKP